MSALARVEALHTSREQLAVVGACANEECEHEELADCETVTLQVCVGCEPIAEAVEEYYMERNARAAEWPCATIRVLRGDQPEHIHDGDVFAAGTCCGAPHCKAAPHIEGCYATDPAERDDTPIVANHAPETAR